MRKNFAFLFIVALLCSFTTKAHETYLSVTEIEYNKEQKSLQIISRVFIDDLENVLSKRYQKDISLSYEEDLEVNKEIIAKYLDKKFNLTVNGQVLKLKLLGSKFDADQVVMFIECTNVDDFGEFRVENLILTDLFDSQKNIVHVKNNGTIESMLLVKGNGSKTLNF